MTADLCFVRQRHITMLNLPQNHPGVLLGDGVFARDSATAASPWMGQGALDTTMTFSTGSRD